MREHVIAAGVGGMLLLVGGCSTDDAAPVPSQQTSSQAPAQGRSVSRAYTVETLEELVLRSDSVVVGRVDGPAPTEPADDEGKGGLMVSTFPFTVTENLEGKTPTDATIDVSVLPVRGMEGQIAVLKTGKTCAAFLEKTSLRGEARFIPVGGVGVYEVRADGSLHRTEYAPDKFPRKIASLGDLRQVIDPVSLLESDTCNPSWAAPLTSRSLVRLLQLDRSTHNRSSMGIGNRAEVSEATRIVGTTLRVSRAPLNYCPRAAHSHRWRV